MHIFTVLILIAVAFWLGRTYQWYQNRDDNKAAYRLGRAHRASQQDQDEAGGTR